MTIIKHIDRHTCHKIDHIIVYCSGCGDDPPQASSMKIEYATYRQYIGNSIGKIKDIYVELHKSKRNTNAES